MKIRNFVNHYTFIVIVLAAILAACGQTNMQTGIIGKWQAVLGGVSGLGVVTDYTEFFKDGTVTSRTKATDFVGNYKFIADDTIRIDWKEQGLFGNSPTQIFKVKLNGDKLTLTNDANGNSILYFKSEAIQSNPMIACESDQSQLDLERNIIGYWYGDKQTGMGTDGTPFAEGRTTYEFLENGTFTYFRDIVESEGASYVGRRARGKYTITSPNSIELSESDESKQESRQDFAFGGYLETSITINVLTDNMVICRNNRPPQFLIRSQH